MNPQEQALVDESRDGVNWSIDWDDPSTWGEQFGPELPDEEEWDTTNRAAGHEHWDES